MNRPAPGRHWFHTVLALALLASSVAAPFHSVRQGRVLLLGVRHHAAHQAAAHVRGFLPVGPVVGFRALVGVSPQGGDVFVPAASCPPGMIAAYPTWPPDPRPAGPPAARQSTPLRC
ncbi:MAG: hypothetical protein U0835_01525 [Isosphaeraceae bacterium]